MAERLNYRVEITPVTAENTVDMPSIGLFGGSMVWVVNYDDIYTSSNSKAGILAEKWIGAMTKGAIVDRSGNTSTIGGGEITVTGTSGLLRELDDINVTIYNAMITIAIRRGSGAYEVIRTGIVTQSQNEIVKNSIPFQDITKSYNTTITKEIGDSGAFYPVNFGESDKSKTVTVGVDFEVPLLAGLVPVFKVVSDTVEFESVFGAPAYAQTVDSDDVEAWCGEMNAFIASGNSIAMVQGDKKRALLRCEYSSELVRFSYQFGDNKNDPILDSREPADFLLFEPVGSASYTDYFGGEFASTELETIEDGKYKRLPEFLDQTIFDSGNVHIVDEDGAGWVDEFSGQTPTRFTVEADELVGFFPSGDVGSIVDGDLSTAFTMNVSTTENATTEFRVFTEGLELNTKEQLSELVIAGRVVISGVVSGLTTTFGVGIRLRDKFGQETLTEFDEAEFWSSFSRPLLNTVFPSTYGTRPTLSQREGFLYGNDSYTVEIAGVECLADLSAFTEAVQWKSGITADVYVKARFGFLTDLIPVEVDVQIDIADLRLFSKQDYSSDEIYCDWRGREKDAPSFYADVAPWTGALGFTGKTFSLPEDSSSQSSTFDANDFHHIAEVRAEVYTGVAAGIKYALFKSQEVGGFEFIGDIARVYAGGGNWRDFTGLIDATQAVVVEIESVGGLVKTSVTQGSTSLSATADTSEDLAGSNMLLATPAGVAMSGTTAFEVIATLPAVYEHAIQLQDYGNRFVEAPADGWGKAYPDVADWGMYYDGSEGYGGLNSGLLEYRETSFQILSESDARTDSIKKEIAKLLWALGSVDRGGVEKLYPLVDALYNEDGVQIRYGEMVPNSFSFKDKKYADIFATPNVTYAYDAGLERNTKSINIAQVEQSVYDSSYVTGVSDPSFAAELWNYGRVIYKVWSVKNELPKQLSDLGWIQNEGAAIGYIRNVYRWQGATVQDGLFLGRDRYTATFKLPYTVGLDKGIDVGTPIQVAVPNKTYYGFEAFHSGVVTSITENIGIPEPTMTIKAEMVGGARAGSDKTIYIQGTDSAETITQGADSDKTITQGT